MMRRALVCALACVGACAGAPETTSPDVPLRAEPRDRAPSARGGRPPTTMERGVVDRLARDAERIRGLTFREPVTVEIQDPPTIAAHLDGELDDADLARAKLVYGTLGLLPEDIDLRALLSDVMGEQVLGYYDTQAQKLVLRDEVARMLLRAPSSRGATEARVVIVHELVHALQDQRLDFGRLVGVERDSDVDNALKAIAEGDATLSMIFYAAGQARVTPEELLESTVLDRMVRGLSVPAGDDALGRAPAILRFTLVVPYLAGVGFVRRLYEDGGWAEVDAAFRTLPASSEQVMHPRAYLRREEPDAIALPELSELTEAGWELVEEDTLGELELGVFLGRFRQEEVDRRAAEGWGGDRLRVYRKDGAGAAVWFTTWDDDSEAREAEAAARRDPDQRVERRGRGVLVLRHLPAPLQSPVVEAFETFAAGLAPQPPRAPSTVAP